MSAQWSARWVERAAQAFTALADGLQDEAAELWLGMLEESGRTVASYPYLAAAQNNAGVAYALRGQSVDAVYALEEAERLWARTFERLEKTEVPVTGRSSTFHVRLALRHHAVFASHLRRRYELMCKTGAGITDFNRRRVQSLAPGDAKDRDLIVLLKDVFGSRCAEVSMLEDTSNGRADANLRLSFYRQKADRVLALNDHPYSEKDGFCREIEQAAQLTALLHPGLRAGRRWKTAVGCARTQAR